MLAPRLFSKYPFLAHHNAGLLSGQLGRKWMEWQADGMEVREGGNSGGQTGATLPPVPQQQEKFTLCLSPHLGHRLGK